VNEVTARLDTTLTAFFARRLEERYPYPNLDARYEQAFQHGGTLSSTTPFSGLSRSIASERIHSMADDNGASKTIETLEKQIAQMRRDITRLNRALAERAGEATEEAGGWLGNAAEQASRATGALRTQAQAVTETVRENPGTVSSAMVLGGVIGFILGIMFSEATAPSHRRWY
jgi:hypothetical protein